MQKSVNSIESETSREVSMMDRQLHSNMTSASIRKLIFNVANDAY